MFVFVSISAEKLKQQQAEEAKQRKLKEVEEVCFEINIDELRIFENFKFFIF